MSEETTKPGVELYAGEILILERLGQEPQRFLITDIKPEPGHPEITALRVKAIKKEVHSV